MLAAFLLVAVLGALKDLRKPGLDYNAISVTGEGKAVSIPDIAVFSFTVSADAKVVSDTQEQVTKKMDKILASLKELGIEEKDIRTSSYNVYPKYVYAPRVCTPEFCEPGRQVPDGYTASHSVSVKVRKTGDAGKALSVAGENGASNVSGVSFAIDDPEKIYDKARAEAITSAKRKAEALADELDVKLVRVVGYYDNTGGVVPYYAEAGMGGDMAVKTSASAPTLPPGENEVKVTVTVTYEIR